MITINLHEDYQDTFHAFTQADENFIIAVEAFREDLDGPEARLGTTPQQRIDAIESLRRARNLAAYALALDCIQNATITEAV